jgi:glutathione synthase/RimK-type ligase-like ATP-grasp enzyme
MTYETFRRFAIVPFWTLYGRVRRGWRRAYAAHMLACSRKEKAWDSEMEWLRRAAEKSRSPVPRAWRLAALKLEYTLFKGFCGADFRQDFADQLRNPFPYYARLVTNGRTRFVRRMLNGPEAFALCGDKARSAEHWKDWYRRRWRLLSEDDPMDARELEFLLDGKKTLVAKPAAGYGGEGIEFVDVSRFAGPEDCVRRLNSRKGRWFLEEFIEQTGPLHDMNPSSVNTVRVITVRRRDGAVEPLNAYLRVGRSGAAVDNLSSGGRHYVVDLETGRFGAGSDGNGNCLMRPAGPGDKGEFPRIPRWEEVLEFCRSAHRHAPEGLGYAGWDVCVSEDGLRLVEANATPGHGQPFSPWENPWRRMKRLLDRELDG